jgi:hypothetical protein
MAGILAFRDHAEHGREGEMEEAGSGWLPCCGLSAFFQSQYVMRIDLEHNV